MRKLKAMFKLMRPDQWTKNLFVLAGVFFAGKWSQPEALYSALQAFAAFCLASSASYCLNDLKDLEKDRAHATKKNRPLASGVLDPKTAFAMALLLAAAGFVIAYLESPRMAAVVAAYLCLNIMYSLFLKLKVIIDVFCIAFGFMMRIAAGTIGIAIAPSPWLVLCTMLLSLFLGFSKRYAELAADSNPLSEKREVLKKYSLEYLRSLLSVCMSATILAYGLYTVNPRTIEVHHTENLIYTLPIVAFGMFRYLFLVMRCDFGENASAEILRDKHLLLTAAMYLVSVSSILYFRV
jgi:4-hydroxybenzoate polyprenyltransferase